MENSLKGSLVCAGSGMRLGGQMTARVRSIIENADVVLAAPSSHLSIQLIKSMSKEFIDLTLEYGEGGGKGKASSQTYDDMAAAIHAQVKMGKQVAAIFYGHPMVFACVAKKAINLVREEGFTATVEPGICASDCLFADLEMDPATDGEQSMESTKFLIQKKLIDNTSLLILWQPGVVGDLTGTWYETNPTYVQLLVDKLATYYPLDHDVILYEAATSPLETRRIEHIQLGELAQAELKQITTLVVPPLAKAEFDQHMIDKIKTLEAVAWQQKN
ncbi:SAM-dependent methyltransferase [Ferrimonas aestuarii]|uniref:Tetrapyrrole methylase domain-containing protein n=1 Tax=Ferrimonas aestuarii TaxID=2569539 RepID=A0A4U1BKF5_9GAMM|nr:SAM-dependent methyltransferase [Ferrimonas aestuarii]TKB52797.1 hypothetical protein FCL42_15930 [Ferrimonas aestuarii]